jgi:hypothetical protein
VIHGPLQAASRKNNERKKSIVDQMGGIAKNEINLHARQE